MQPKPIEQQLVLEDRNGSATYDESVKRISNNWILMNSTGRADMGLETMEKLKKTTMEDKKET